MSSSVLTMKQLSTAAQCCLTSLRTPFTTHSSLPFKPDRFFYRSCSSSSQFPSRVSLKKKVMGFNLTPCVAQTSDWARQDEEEEEIVEKDVDLAWENQQTSDDTEARGSESDWEESQESSNDEEIVEKDVDLAWENQQTSDDTRARGSESVWEESQESSNDGAVLKEDDGEGYSEPPEEAKLFVGNIPYDIDSEGLAKVFEPAGFVEIAEVIYTRGTGQSRGFGFVTMSTVEEAEKAVEMYHRYELGGRLLTVNKAAPRGTQPERAPRAFEPAYKIYVGNIPWDCDDSRLGEAFSEYGTVVNSRVVYDRESNRSRGFGFVTMSTEEEMNKAVGALDGQDFGGRALRVSVAEDRARPGSFF